MLDVRVSSRAAAPRRLGPPCLPHPFSAWDSNFFYSSVLAVTTPLSGIYFLPSQRVVLCHDNIWRHAHVLWTSTCERKQQWEPSCRVKKKKTIGSVTLEALPSLKMTKKKDQNAALLLWKMAKAPSARPEFQSRGIGDEEKKTCQTWFATSLAISLTFCSHRVVKEPRALLHKHLCAAFFFSLSTVLFVQCRQIPSRFSLWHVCMHLMTSIDWSCLHANHLLTSFWWHASVVAGCPLLYCDFFSWYFGRWH